jgi:hypothetical protein
MKYLENYKQQLNEQTASHSILKASQTPIAIVKHGVIRGSLIGGSVGLGGSLAIYKAKDLYYKKRLENAKEKFNKCKDEACKEQYKAEIIIITNDLKTNRDNIPGHIKNTIGGASLGAIVGGGKSLFGK